MFYKVGVKTCPFCREQYSFQHSVMLWNNDAQKGKSPSPFCESWEVSQLNRLILHLLRLILVIDSHQADLWRNAFLCKVVPVFRTEGRLDEVWLTWPVWPAGTLDDWLENLINIWHCDSPLFHWANASLRSYPKQRNWKTPAQFASTELPNR